MSILDVGRNVLGLPQEAAACVKVIASQQRVFRAEFWQIPDPDKTATTNKYSLPKVVLGGSSSAHQLPAQTGAAIVAAAPAAH